MLIILVYNTWDIKADHYCWLLMSCATWRHRLLIVSREWVTVVIASSYNFFFSAVVEKCYRKNKDLARMLIYDGTWRYLPLDDCSHRMPTARSASNQVRWYTVVSVLSLCQIFDSYLLFFPIILINWWYYHRQEDQEIEEKRVEKMSSGICFVCMSVSMYVCVCLCMNVYDML